MCATSGTPELAVMAFCSAVYCLPPVPALTSSTSTLGYFASNDATTFFRVGSHDHTRSLPPLVRAASGSEPEGLGVSALEHAARARTSTPAIAASRVAAVRLNLVLTK